MLNLHPGFVVAFYGKNSEIKIIVIAIRSIRLLAHNRVTSPIENNRAIIPSVDNSVAQKSALPW